MAFANVAGSAGFVLDLDATKLETGLAKAEQEFVGSVNRMDAAAQKMSQSGLYSSQQVNLAQKYGLTDLINQNDELEGKLAKTNAQIAELEAGSTAAGTATSALGAGLGGLVARAGLVGYAITAAYEASQKLGEVLHTTGAESYTAEGKIRNLGEALLHGDVIGGIEALARQPHTLADLGTDAQQSGYKLDDLRKASELLGGSVTDVYEDMLKQTEAMDAQATSAIALADALDKVRQAGSEAAAFGERGTSEGRGVGGVTSERDRVRATGGTTVQGVGGVSLADQIREDRASRIRNEGARLQAVLAAQTLTERHLRQAFENVRGDPTRGPTAWQTYQAAKSRRVATENSIQDNIEKANRDAAAEADRRRKARQQAAERAATERARQYREDLDTQEQNLRNAYQAALQTPGLRDDQRRYVALRRFFQVEGRDPRLEPGERADYRGELLTLRGQRAKDIETADAAADKLAQDRAKTLEQRLKNRVAAAENTKNTIADDLKALRGLRDYYRRAAKDKKDIWTDYQQAQFEFDAIETQGKIQALREATAQEDAALAKTYFTETNRILAQFSSNVMAGATPGTRPATVIVNQNFKAPTLDRTREARMARFAAEAQWLG